MDAEGEVTLPRMLCSPCGAGRGTDVPGRDQSPSHGAVQDPAPVRARKKIKARLYPEAGRTLDPALRAPLPAALGFEQFLVAPERATVMAGHTTMTLGPWGSHLGPWAETAVWFILNPISATESDQPGALWLYPAGMHQQHAKTCTSSHPPYCPLVSGNCADLGVSAPLPMAPDVWRVFSSSQHEGGCTDSAGLCLYNVLLQRW